MTDWPAVTIIVGGDVSLPAAKRTVDSLQHTRYAGDLQILAGDPGEPGSPAEVTNDHVGEARGDYIMMVPPGTVLDPDCIRHLVDRARADEGIVAVALQWRSHDGTVLEAGSHLHASDEITPLFRGARLPEWLERTPYQTQVSTQPSLLVRARDFFMVEGFTLDLDGSPYQAAHLALSLTALGGRIEVEPQAVAFAPPAEEPDPYALVHGRNRLQADFSESLDQLHFQSSIDADLSVLLGNQHGTRTLWVSPHLPDGRRSGADARHLEMIQALVSQENEVVVWAMHTDGRDGAPLDALGVRWVAQPHRRRWDLRPSDAAYPWLRELIRQLHWDHVVISDVDLVDRVGPLVRELSPTTSIILDLAGVRWPAAHREQPGAVAVELPDESVLDGVVAATGPDLEAVRHGRSDVASSVFSALGSSGPSPGPDAESLLFIGNLVHRPNAEAVAWWIESVAGRVEAAMGRPAPLRIVGYGSEVYRSVWNHPTKIDIGGWQSNLASELARARVLLVPLTYATGTGGRIATALRHGVPTVASGPAAAVLPGELAQLVHVGQTAEEIATWVATLMTDDATWQAAVDRIRAWDPVPWHNRQTASFAAWAQALEPAAPAPA